MQLTTIDQLPPIEISSITQLKKIVEDLEEQPYVFKGDDGTIIEFPSLADLEAFAGALNDPPVAALQKVAGVYVGDTWEWNTAGTSDPDDVLDSHYFDTGSGAPRIPGEPPQILSHVPTAPGALKIRYWVVDSDGAQSNVVELEYDVLPRPEEFPPEPPHIPGPEGHFDRVPDFAANPDTIFKNGAWTNGEPGPDSVAVVADQETWTLPLGTKLVVKTLRIDGTFLHKGELWVQNFIVGAKEGGQWLTYPGSELVYRNRPLDLTFDPSQFGNGGLVWARWHTMGENRTPTNMLRLDGGIAAGVTTLPFVAAPVDWQPGDRLVLPDSDQVPFIKTSSATWRKFTKTEEVTIKSVDGTTVTLTAPTKFSHPGNPKDGRGPHAGHLTRSNIVIRSEDPNGVRGHMLLGDKADINIHSVTVVNMGRTTVQQLNSTEYNVDGSVAHMGTNQIGRYPLHCHHLFGPTRAAGEPQFTIEDCVVERSNKWPIALHGSHYGSVQRNVIYEGMTGSGIMTEDGGESYNHIKWNFVVKMDGRNSDDSRSGIGQAFGGGNGSDTAFEGSGIWGRGGNNYVENNVVCACPAQGFVMANGYYNRGAVVPKSPDWNHHNPATYIVYGSVPGEARGLKQNIPFLTNKDNEAYAIGGAGFWLTWGGSMTGADHQDWTPFVVHNPRAWHCMKNFFESWHQGNVTVFNLTGDNDPKVTELAPTWSRHSEGIHFGTSYEVNRHRFVGGRITGVHVGFATPGNYAGPQPFIVEGITIEAPIIIQCVMATNATGTFHARDIDGKFITLKMPSQSPVLTGDKALALMSWSDDPNRGRILAPTNYTFENVNGLTGRVWWNAQEGSYVVPMDTDDPLKLSGYPEAGLTNTQGKAKGYGCIGGEILPPNAVVNPLIKGGKFTS